MIDKVKIRRLNAASNKKNLSGRIRIMLKKIITVSLLGVSALALMNANAATTSDTTTTQNTVKHAKKHHAVKPVVYDQVDTSSQLQTISVEPTANQSAAAGIYVTGQLGYAQSGLNAKIAGKNNHLSNGAAERVALGYKLNNNAALEVGFLHLHNGTAKGNFNSGVFENIQTNVSSKQNAFDIAAKGILPVAQNVNVYGKVGVAYLTTRADQTSTSSAGLNPVYLNKGQKSISVSSTQHNWAPEVAVGVSYDLTSNVSVDASVTHIHPMGSNKPGNINFAAVGLGYTFG